MNTACCVDITLQNYVSRLFIYPSIPTQEESLGQLRGAVVKLRLRLQDGALGTEVASADLC